MEGAVKYNKVDTGIDELSMRIGELSKQTAEGIVKEGIITASRFVSGFYEDDLD